MKGISRYESEGVAEWGSQPPRARQRSDSDNLNLPLPCAKHSRKKRQDGVLSSATCVGRGKAVEKRSTNSSQDRELECKGRESWRRGDQGDPGLNCARLPIMTDVTREKKY